MKTMRLMMAIATIAAMPLLFTSCDDDPDYWYDNWTWGDNYNNRPDDGNVDNDDFFVAMAQTLNGQWRGDLKAYEVEVDDKGNSVAVDSIYYSTDIEFKQYNSQAISGTGTQYDYDPNTGNKVLERDFTWYIDPKTGDIYLTYKEKQTDGSTSDYVMRIRYDDLNLSNRSFTGYLWSSDGQEVDDFWFDRYTGSNAKAATRATTTGKTHWVVKMTTR